MVINMQTNEKYLLVLLLTFLHFNLLLSQENNDSVLIIVPIKNYNIDSSFSDQSDKSKFDLSSFQESLITAAKSNLNYKQVYLGDYDANQKLTQRLLYNENTQFIMRLPQDNESLIFQSNQMSDVLFIDDLKIKHNKESNENISVSFEYALWDNQKTRLIKYGLKSISKICNIKNIHDCITEILKKSFGKMNQSLPIEYIESKSHRVSFKILPSRYFHIIKKDEDNPNIPNEYENPQEHPSVGHYFNDNFSFIPAIEYCYYNNKIRVSVGLEYHQEQLEKSGKALLTINDIPPSKQSLKITSFGAFISVGKCLDERQLTYAYFKVGLSKVQFESQLKINQFKVDLDLNDSYSPAFIIGIDTNIKNSGICLIGELGYEICSTTIKKAIVQSQEIPFKNGSLSDHRMFGRIGLSYLLDL